MLFRRTLTPKGIETLGGKPRRHDDNV